MNNNTLTQDNIMTIIIALQEQLNWLHQSCDTGELTQSLIEQNEQALANIRKLKEPSL